MAESMQYETFIISAHDSSIIYTKRCKLQNILCECLLTSLPGVGSSDKPQTKLKLRVKGGQGLKGPGYTSSRGRLEKHSSEAVEAGVEERVSSATQRQRLSVVGHHVREGAVWAEASDGAALPAINRPPVEHSPAHQRSTLTFATKTDDKSMRSAAAE